MKRIKLDEHLTVEEIGQRYRRATDAVGRSQWQIIWLLAQGQRTEEVAAVTGYSIEWVRALARRYNAGGAEAMGDKRHQNPGQRLKLTPEQQYSLKQLLTEAAQRAESWTGRQVAEWMTQQVGQYVYPQRGWEMLRRLGFTSKTARPRHVKATVEGASLFKKT